MLVRKSRGRVVKRGAERSKNWQQEVGGVLSGKQEIGRSRGGL